MLIISKFKDFYDGIVGTYGIDKTIVYERNIVEFEKKEIPKELHELTYIQKYQKLDWFKLKDDSIYTDYSFFYIGFCGKMYMGWVFKDKKGDIHISYDLDKVKKNFKLSNKSKYRFFNENSLSDFDKGVNNVLNFDPIEIHRKYNTPIFVYDDNRYMIDGSIYLKRKNPKFIVNPLLSDYKFVKALDIVTVFQEIQMFISGVLGVGERNIIEIDDKYKIPQHGFDNWSFKRRPHKKNK
jgi:hypothetical protein